MQDKSKKTVVVGMSGGVDSSVAALLLKEQGYNVIGLFMDNWEEKDDSGVCTATEDYEDVRRVCDKIGIPYYSVNFAKEYLERVFSNFLSEYKKGRTPNPDVLCNREIKFGPFLNYAKMLGADYIATGHYCKVEQKDGLFYLKKSKDKSKDQSYFLNQLSQHQLSSVIFPLADIEKTEVRKIALENDLVNAKKKDSTGVCFIGERNFKKFLSQYIPAKKGDIVDVHGEVVGTHDGVLYYTLGQRKGLKIGGKSGGNGERWFVLAKDVKNNKLIVSQGEDDKLFSSWLVATDFNWIPQIPANKNFDCFAKFRYRQPDQKVNVQIIDNKVKVVFYEKQRAVTPGQFVVLYDQDENCLGGGVIDEVVFD
ncbi:MAG: tRNA 2-thiouridine(34) synthase MnmA [Clostridia bacterium]|nr:tRNA 2-thiouridine(34) synthase MnmA [Clostridia bacterium]